MESSRSLYLRWRPRRFGDVIAQDPVTRTLKNAVVRGSVAHAYLLCGPRGTGKTSIARILYRAINCLNPADGEPCGSCASCQAVDEGRAVDLIEMDAASHGGIDDVRDLRERVYFAPVDAKCKVYIVDEAHQLTSRAWDAFLKTLEEPPPRTVFVLATTEAHRVPATIVSRCQRFDLRRIPQARLAEQLEKVAEGEALTLESGVAERLARLARGSLRDGESMLEQVAAFGGSTVTMEGARNVLGLVRGDALRSYLDALSVGDAPRALQLVEDVAEQGADLRQFLDELLTYLRGTLLARSGASSALETSFGPEERAWLTQIAERWAPGQILGVLRAFGEIESRGRDEHHVLVRTELVTAWAAGLVDRGAPVPTGTVAPPVPPTPEADAAASPAATGATAASELSPDPGESERASQGEPSTQDPAAPAGLAPEPREPVKQESLASATGSAKPAERVRLSVAKLDAEWPAVVQKLKASVWTSMRLQSVHPSTLNEGVVTLAGPLDLLDLQRLDVPDLRASVEAALEEALGVPLRVKFVRSAAGGAAGSDSSVEDARAEDEPPTSSGGRSLADLGSSLFGGHLIVEG